MAVPRWLTGIQEALHHPLNDGMPVYQIATIDSQKRVPRVRTIAHRQFISPKGAPNLPALLLSTNVRTDKVKHVVENPAVDLALWLEGSREQFRVSGRAFVIPAPQHPLYASCAEQLKSSPALAALAADGIEGEEGASLDWETRRLAAFATLPPALRAGMCIPEEPGSVIDYDELKKYPRMLPKPEDAEGEDVKANVSRALENFVLFIVEPTEVEWLRLTERPNRRTLFTRAEGGEHEWKEETLVP